MKRVKEEIFTEIINYGHKHKAIPNNHGDYDLICPKLGKTMFIPILLREGLEGYFCRCGERLNLLKRKAK